MSSGERKRPSSEDNTRPRKTRKGQTSLDAASVASTAAAAAAVAAAASPAPVVRRSPRQRKKRVASPAEGEKEAPTAKRPKRPKRTKRTKRTGTAGTNKSESAAETPTAPSATKGKKSGKGKKGRKGRKKKQKASKKRSSKRSRRQGKQVAHRFLASSSSSAQSTSPTPPPPEYADAVATAFASLGSSAGQQRLGRHSSSFAEFVGADFDNPNPSLVARQLEAENRLRALLNRGPPVLPAPFGGLGGGFGGFQTGGNNNRYGLHSHFQRGGFVLQAKELPREVRAFIAQQTEREEEAKRRDQRRPHRNRGGAFGGGRGRMSAQLSTLVEGIQDVGDETRQLICLTQLSEYLAMAQEETVQGFPTDVVAPALVNLLNYEHNPDMMLLALRALTHLMEVLPASCNAINSAGAIPIFVARVLTFEYIDLAENAIQALEKISYEHPTAVLTNGGLGAVLPRMGFFSLSLQRVCLTIAANICRNMTPDNFELLREALPTLTSILNYDDKKMLETACLCFSRLTEVMVEHEDHLTTMVDYGMVGNMLMVLGAEPQIISPGTVTLIIRMFATLARVSPSIALSLLQNGIIDTLKSMLRGADGESGADGLSDGADGSFHGPLSPRSPRYAAGASAAGSGVSRSPEQMFEILALANYLLPHLSFDLPSDLFAPVPAPSLFNGLGRGMGSHVRAMPELRAPESRTEAENDRIAARTSLFDEHPNILYNFASSLLGVFVRIFGASLNPNVKYRCLAATLKVVTFGTEDMLTDLLREMPISSFVARLLGEDDVAVTGIAILLAETLLDRLPDIFRRYFPREGVVFEMERLAATADEARAALAAAEAADEEAKAASGVTDAGSEAPNMYGAPAPDAASHARAAAIRTAGARVWLAERADAFVSGHFTNTSAGDGADTPLGRLRQACESLAALSEADKVTSADLDALRDLCGLLTASSDGISTFELVSAGMVETLFDYLTGWKAGGGGGAAGKGAKGKSALTSMLDAVESRSVEFGDLVRDRLQAFCHVFMAMPKPEVLSTAEETAEAQRVAEEAAAAAAEAASEAGAASGSGAGEDVADMETDARSFLFDAPVLVLVRQLHEVLSKVEKLPVELMSATSSNASLRVLTSPLRIKLTRAEGETRVDDHTGSSFSIEPLATVASVERFLLSQLPADQVQNLMTMFPAPNASDAGPGESSEGQTSTSEAATEAAAAATAAAAAATEAAEAATGEADDGIEIAEETEGAAVVDEAEAALEAALEGAADGHTDRSGQLLRGLRTRSARRMKAAATPTPISEQRHMIAFMIGDRVLNFHDNIYQVVRTIRDGRETVPGGASGTMWDETYELTYRVIAEEELAEAVCPREAPIYERATPEHYDHINGVSPLAPAIEHSLGCPFPSTDPIFVPLLTLRLLNALNTDAHTLYSFAMPQHTCVAPREFCSSVLAAKLRRQLQDPLPVFARALPAWCAQLVASCPFLFPFATRATFFKSTAFSVARVLEVFQSRTRAGQVAGRDNSFKVGRVLRQKVRINRERMLDSAIRVMDMFATSNAIIDVEFYGEEGTGLGPTLEFYTKVSEALQAKDLRLWRGSNATEAPPSQALDEGEQPENALDLVDAIHGLFPSPLPPDAPDDEVERVTKLFNFAGAFVAKAMMDSRLVDLPLSVPFLRALRGDVLALTDLAEIEEMQAQSFRVLARLAAAKAAILDDDSLDDSAKAAAVADLRDNGVRVSDMTLAFTLPGYPEIELCEGGSETDVTIDNLEAFLAAVQDYTFGAGVARQIAAFRAGFSAVCPLHHIAQFSVGELETMLLGEDATWTVDDFFNNAVVEHGYDKTDAYIHDLFEILASFNLTERRQFLQFLTGSSRLPVGGWKALDPPLTIVRKSFPAEVDPNDYLPSVMTCQSYMKIPTYRDWEGTTAKAHLARQLRRAMSEGLGAFLLS